MKWILGLGAVGAVGAIAYYFMSTQREMAAKIQFDHDRLNAGLPAGMQMSQMAGYYR